MKDYTLTDDDGDTLVLEEDLKADHGFVLIRTLTAAGVYVTPGDLRRLADEAEAMLGVDRKALDESPALSEEKRLLIEGAKDLLRRAMPDDLDGDVVVFLGGGSR